MIEITYLDGTPIERGWYCRDMKRARHRANAVLGMDWFKRGYRLKEYRPPGCEPDWTAWRKAFDNRMKWAEERMQKPVPAEVPF